MSAPLRQQTLLARSVLQCHNPSAPSTTTHIQRRTFLGNLFGRGKDKSKSKATQKAENPFLADLLSRKSNDARAAAEQEQRNRTRGDLSASSLFSTPEDTQNRSRRAIDSSDETQIQGQRRNLQDLAVALDPQPRKRENWQRRRVIASLRRRERPTAEQFRRLTEREITVHSANLKTSVKKLGPLARQIQGKTVEEAIVQMRFSKKKIAQQVREHLEYARDRAVVAKGMGLGGRIEGEEGKSAEQQQPIDIQRKDGSRQTVADKSEIYVDQAWVGRGPYGKLPDYRARGRMNLIRTPWTHLALKLKEQGTLVREWQEREAKRQKKRAEKVWTPLPDRPLHGQNQYYTW